jgi:hypothetical protein
MSDELTLFTSIATKKGFNKAMLADIVMVTEDIFYGTFDAVTLGDEFMRPRFMVDQHTFPARGMGVTNVLVLVSSNRPFVTDTQREERREVAQRLYDEVFPELRIIVSFGKNLVGNNVIAIDHWMMDEDKLDELADSLREGVAFAVATREFDTELEGDANVEHAISPVADLAMARLRHLPEDQQVNAVAALTGLSRPHELVSSMTVHADMHASNS